MTATFSFFGSGVNRTLACRDPDYLHHFFGGVLPSSCTLTRLGKSLLSPSEPRSSKGGNATDLKRLAVYAAQDSTAQVRCGNDLKQSRSGNWMNRKGVQRAAATQHAPVPLLTIRSARVVEEERRATGHATSRIAQRVGSESLATLTSRGFGQGATDFPCPRCLEFQGDTRAYWVIFSLVVHQRVGTGETRQPVLGTEVESLGGKAQSEPVGENEGLAQGSPAKL